MHDFVEIQTVNPKIVLDIRYATPHNFTGKRIYRSSRCFLRRKTAEKLHRVQLALETRGLGLKVYDGYRPLSVQKIFWNFISDPRYVADPAVGSKHNRGASVDVTLVDERGEELAMPTPFDDFSEKAGRAYQGGSKEALFNRDLLQRAMEAEQFIPFAYEWWHFDDPDWKNYPVVDLCVEDLAP